MSPGLRLFPSTLAGHSPSPHQEQVFTAFKRHLNKRDYWIWFRPSLRLGNRSYSPDFVLLGPESGLLVLETVTSGGARVPADRTRRLAAELKERGLPEIHVGWGVIRTGKTPDPNIDPKRCLALSELGDTNGLLRGLKRVSGGGAADIRPDTRERIRAVIEPQLHFLDVREEEEQSSVAPPGSSTQVPAASSEPLGFWLDRKQERMARELASPKTLVYGPAGSGKTVFLVSRAEYWMDRNPSARILFTCYNASLASHLRRVFASRGVAADGERLTVMHYHALCGSLLGITDIHERSPEFYAGLEPRVFQELARRDDVGAYDLILIDEGQDFTRRMLELLVRMIETGGEITLVCDPAQDIYERWSPDNLAPLREPAVEHLMDCYRNTAPIFSLALDVLSPELKKTMGLGRLEMTRPEDLGRMGPEPELPNLEGLDDLVGLIAAVSRDVTAAGRPLSDLAVLYSSRHAIPGFGSRLRHSRWTTSGEARFQEETEPVIPDQDPSLGTLHPQSDRDDMPPSPRSHFAEALERELLSRDIPVEWVARDFASKAAYDISKPRLTLSTVHSAKGMDYHTVVLLGAETLNPGPGKDGQRAETLLFTGITRARERLVIPYFEPEGWIPALQQRRD